MRKLWVSPADVARLTPGRRGEISAGQAGRKTLYDKMARHGIQPAAHRGRD